MLRIAPGIAIDEKEVQFDFLAASGPGGQNVNKVATAAQLRFDAAHCPALGEGVLRRLATLAGRRMTREGVIIIQAQRFRSQERNRQDALERLIALLQDAATPPVRRRATRPTRASGERRLAAKRERAERKRDRGVPTD